MEWNYILIGAVLLFALTCLATVMGKKEMFETAKQIQAYIDHQGYRGKQFKNTYDEMQQAKANLSAYNAKITADELQSTAVDRAFRRNLNKAAENQTYREVLRQQMDAYDAMIPFIKQGSERVKPAAKVEAKAATKEEGKPEGKKEGFEYQLGLPLYIGGLK